VSDVVVAAVELAVVLVNVSLDAVAEELTETKEEAVLIIVNVLSEKLEG